MEAGRWACLLTDVASPTPCLSLADWKGVIWYRYVDKVCQIIETKLRGWFTCNTLQKWFYIDEKRCVFLNTETKCCLWLGRQHLTVGYRLLTLQRDARVWTWFVGNNENAIIKWIITASYISNPHVLTSTQITAVWLPHSAPLSWLHSVTPPLTRTYG